MPPFRNFFPKRPSVNVEPAAEDSQASPSNPPADNKGSDNRLRPSLNIRRSRDDEPNEYKMSVVNDSGVYLPPSPPEKKGVWRRSQSQNNRRNLTAENEPFSISRESFDSYRRSFDISARSPISQTDTATSRTSLDSRLSRPTHRPMVNGSNFEPPEPTEEEGFEEVGLNDDVKPKKKGFFARFGDSAAQTSSGQNNRPATPHLGFHLPGRKRDQGHQGSELGNMTNSSSKE